MSRAENLADVLNGKSVGPPARGHGISTDDRGKAKKGDKPLPSLDEDGRPGGYVGRRRRGERD